MGNECDGNFPHHMYKSFKEAYFSCSLNNCSYGRHGHSETQF